MKKSSIILVCILLSAQCFSQITNKSSFLLLKNWSAVLKKAKAENKYIFLDAYATWCGPCKEMDNNIYTDKEVDSNLNRKFVNVKVQFDQTTNDSEYIKQWRADAIYLQNKYKIDAFPSFLFFNSNGELVGQEFGYKNKKEFLNLCNIAADSTLNFIGLRNNFIEGKASLDEKMVLAISSKKLHRYSFASQVAELSISEINQKDPREFLNIDFWDFFRDFAHMFKDEDKFIRYVYTHQAEADSIAKNEGFSKRLIDYLITKNFLNPVLYSDEKIINQDPDWENLEITIRNAWDLSYAKENILSAKIKYYRLKEKWDEVVKYSIEQQDKKGISTVGLNSAYINNLVYGVIFMHSNDPYALKKGIHYMEELLKHDPNGIELLDTYANILYKAGYKEMALINEKKAISILKESNMAIENKNNKISEFKKILDKMEKDQPTWE